MAKRQNIAARTDRQAVTSPAPIVYKLTPAEAEWLAWHHRTSGQPADNVKIEIYVPKTRAYIPGTLEQKLAWIHEYDGTGDIAADVIQASRYKAIYGVWPEGITKLPDIPEGYPQHKLKWLSAQVQWSKFLKWLREVDPPTYDDYVENHYTGRRAPVNCSGRSNADELEELAVEQEVAEGRELLKRKRRLHALRVDRTELKVWFKDNLGLADDLSWLENFAKLTKVEEEITALTADNLLSRVTASPQRSPRRQRQRLERLEKRWSDHLLCVDAIPPGTTLAERIQARRDRRRQGYQAASVSPDVDQLIDELANMDEDEPLPIELTELAISELEGAA